MLYDKNRRRGYRPRVPFGDWFPKLKNMQVGVPFHTIRFIDKYDYYNQLMAEGTEVDVYMTASQETIARCRIIDIRVITFYDFTDELVKADTYPDWDIPKLWALLKKFYQGKSEWDGRNTRFILIYLEPLEITRQTQWQPMYQAEKEKEG